MRKWFGSGRKKRNEEEYRIIYDMYYKRVYRTAYYIVKDPYLAEDVLQDTFLKVFRHWDKAREKENVEAWICVVATRTAIDWLRKKQKAWNGTPIDDRTEIEMARQEAASVEKTAETHLLFESVLEVLSGLPPEDQELIVLKYFHFLKEEEISKQTGVPLGTLKSRLYRLKKRIKNQLNLMEEEEGDAYGKG